ncbi:MAG: hypothetical protein COX81_03405 [Candidatus Magasanikbacteria bacterium CG_4_10_14_0_2_um_filter_37_12]|uniref:Reverse transcriptase domain-containing protein n=1 Tax=Candidatus Magasanikbacteria bacterium CG_4_10_14_0_2_um_filter_37_12 TaxID=1974637 RepID=A0A2M7V732_9BACT|nr:MAG: hypothetical protein COX81_03405 [Candidatus Magasanikbacteria bacterium CG_4_10_14_0_2_um_filter_37_12]
MNWDEFCSVENVYSAWRDFSKGKHNKKDVIYLATELEKELLSLHEDLAQGLYEHGQYTSFTVHDPKERIIHKATVRDRIVHRMIYNYLLPIVHPRFLDCSFSCRPGFGQHRAIGAVQKAIRKSTKNYSHDVIALKCDIKKFFDTIDQDILYRLIAKRIHHGHFLSLVRTVLRSFYCKEPGKGLPIGNLTSQIFANIYMHEFDWFVKHDLRQRWYYRYADDVIFLLSPDDDIEQLFYNIEQFLLKKLQLVIHPNKILVRPVHQGIDWLGKIICPGYTILRTSTRRRMLKKIEAHARMGTESERFASVIGSYHGLLKGTARNTIDRQICQIVALSR